MSIQSSSRFIDDLKKFSGNKITNEEDLGILIQAAADTGKVAEFAKLAFTAKYINGLKRVLKSGGGNPEITNIDQIRQDMMGNYKKLVEQINSLLEGTNEPAANSFSKKYLALDQESLARLNFLLDDLEWVKIFLNDQKRK